MSKLMTAYEAIGMIKDGASVAFGGFTGNMHPEEVSSTLEKIYVEESRPKDLTLLYAAGQGDKKDKGLNHLGHEGLVSKVIGGHWGQAPKLGKLALENKIQAYNLPQGVISHIFRDTAAGKPGTLTSVGLKTFVDPRIEGGKINEVTKEDIVKVVEMDGEEYLFYKPLPVDVAVVRATYADLNGNATFEKECNTLEVLSMCQAAKNSGGKVILQVEGVVEHGTLDTRLVRIPGIYVDAIVVASPENHMQTYAEHYNPSYSGEIRVPVESIKPMDLDKRKIIARRAAMELRPKSITNLGIGMPEGVSIVAAEEGIGKEMILTIESGPIGGVPAGGMSFGAAINPDCILDQPYQFDFYDGGGLDITFLGMAEADQMGNVNVSKFGPKVAGCGGFINISQNAKRVIYMGTFTAAGLKVSARDGKLSIDQEGTARKFVKEVEQITFSGEYAAETDQPVMYITERAVFELDKRGLVLTEIAPGIDLEKDVLGLMDFKPVIAEDLRIMDERIFKPEKMGLTL